ncbi:MAG TPA: YbaK/EbsC family protein [Terriglobales bacterium]|nr:YbaK/EbsC family protein [Terriglobales bacterium]
MTPLPSYSESLRDFLASKGIWHRFVEFNEPVKTVEQASRQVPAEKIVKSIVMIDSNGLPLLAILRAKHKLSFRKIKKLLEVKDVRLASAEEVLNASGFPAGGVPPFNSIARTLLDPKVLTIDTCFVGGGDVDQLLEVKTRDIVEVMSPKIADILDDRKAGLR